MLDPPVQREPDLPNTRRLVQLFMRLIHDGVAVPYT
jgi:hypothetical protein